MLRGLWVVETGAAIDVVVVIVVVEIKRDLVRVGRVGGGPGSIRRVIWCCLFTCGLCCRSGAGALVFAGGRIVLLDGRKLDVQVGRDTGGGPEPVHNLLG